MPPPDEITVTLTREEIEVGVALASGRPLREIPGWRSGSFESKLRAALSAQQEGD